MLAKVKSAAMKQLHLTGCAFHRILKLSRTIADLEHSDIIKTHHMGEVFSIGIRKQSEDKICSIYV